MSRHAPLEYHWEPADPMGTHCLDQLAQDGWEVVPGIVSERNRTVYVLMERLYEIPLPAVVQDEIVLRLPPLVPGWEDKVEAMVADTAERLNAGEDINEIMRNALPPELELKRKQPSSTDYEGNES